MSTNTALIPARKGSQRLPGKNIIDLNGHPLIAYSILAAQKSSIFERIIVSTDCPKIAKIALQYGAEVPSLRPQEISSSDSPDISWVLLAINDWLNLRGEDYIAILRPTNPFRSSSSIVEAFELLKKNPTIDSIRAIRPIKEHPSKMWRGVPGQLITPFDDSMIINTKTPVHSSPFQVLEKLWIQDASLEIARVKAVRESHSISGRKVMGFEMPNIEGFDINYPEDIEFARKAIVELNL